MEGSWSKTTLALTLLIALLFAGFFAANDDEWSFSAKASQSHIFLCVNSPPTITQSCNTTFNQSTRLIDNRITCQLNASDPNNDSFTYSVLPNPLPTGLYAEISTSGLLTVNASDDAVGNRTIHLYVTDDTYCANGNSSVNYSFEVLDINDPPYNFQPIPYSSFKQGTSLSPYSLYDYFMDPDGDSLNFTVSGTHYVSVSIDQVTGDVVYSSSFCERDYLVFRAIDPYGLYDDSNIVEVTPTCTQTPDTSGNGGGSGGGGGGGGGLAYTCRSEWECFEWSECFINNTRQRRCIDTKGCSNQYIRTFVENCTYIPTCNDGVLNGDEIGIDCGGSCVPCGSCSDGILNNDEEDVDCGGSFCEACHNCADGIMNWGETGIDCGGLFCESCPTCNDGIQNQDETGIDCGGSCEECSDVAVPAFFKEEAPLLSRLLILLIALIVIAAVILKLYWKHVHAFTAKIGWLLTRRKRKVILLTNAEKQDLLSDLHSLEQGISDVTVDLLVQTCRKYFSYAVDITYEFTPVDIDPSILKATKRKELRIVLKTFASRLFALETSDVLLTPTAIRLLMQELRVLIFFTSDVTEKDLDRTINELSIPDHAIEAVRATLYNALLAVQFEETVLAKNHYFSVLKRYTSLDESEKEFVYPAVQRLYHEIRYLLSWAL